MLGLSDYQRRYGDALCWPNLARKILGISRSRFEQLIKAGDIVPIVLAHEAFHFFKLREVLKLRQKRSLTLLSPRARKTRNAIVIDEEDVCQILHEAFANPGRRLLF